MYVCTVCIHVYTHKHVYMYRYSYIHTLQLRSLAFDFQILCWRRCVQILGYVDVQQRVTLPVRHVFASPRNTR